jgi:NitT/TauT family transport system substrate-binding protein
LGFLSFLLVASGGSAQPLEKVSISATNAEDVTATIFLYGMEKGLFKSEGIDLTYRFLPPNLALAAVVGRDIDYVSTVGSAFRAAAVGLPIKVIAVGLDKPLFYIMVQPDIKSAKELRGKKFAVSSLQGTGARTTRAGLRSLGLNPDKDVTFIVIGSSATRTLAMETGSVQATAVPSPHNIWMRQKGFRELLFAGKDISEPFVGIATSKEKVANNAVQVKKVLKAFSRSLRAVKKDRKEVIELIARRFKFEHGVAAELYETILQSATKDGTVDQEIARDYLKLVKEETRTDKDIPLAEIADFRLLREVLKEIDK